MQSTIHIHYQGDEPIVARPMEHEGGQTSVALSDGLALFGPRDYLVRLFTAAIDAIGDGSVRWTRDVAEVVPLHPAVNHAATGADMAPACGSGGGLVGPGPVTCPQCMAVVDERNAPMRGESFPGYEGA